MDQNTIEKYPPIYESFITIEEQGLRVRVGFQIKDPTILAGGIVELDFIIENQGNSTVYFLGGGSSSKKRPAYFSFDGNLRKGENRLKDPMQNVVEIGGPVGATKILSGGSIKQKLILNQFLTLEDLFNGLGIEEQDTLQINCYHRLSIGKSENELFANKGTILKNLVLNLSVPIVWDEKKVLQQIQDLTSIIKDQWNSGSSIKEEIAVQKLTLIRIPMVMSYLEQILGHPNISFSFQIQSALTSLKNKN